MFFSLEMKVFKYTEHLEKFEKPIVKSNGKTNSFLDYNEKFHFPNITLLGTQFFRNVNSISHFKDIQILYRTFLCFRNHYQFMSTLKRLSKASDMKKQDC